MATHGAVESRQQKCWTGRKIDSVQNATRKSISLNAKSALLLINWVRTLVLSVF